MFRKLTTLLVVDAIESCLPLWKSLGYEVTVNVPHGDVLGFVILRAAHTEPPEIMLQTHASLREDLPKIAEQKPATLLYADVKSVHDVQRALGKTVSVIVPERKTFYGATEVWVQTPSGEIIGLAQH